MADIGTLSSIGIPAGVLIILGYMQYQIKGKQNKDTCAEIHNSNKAGLSKSDAKFEKIGAKFEKINDTLTSHTETLGRIDEKLKFIAEKNGYKEK